MQIAMKNLILRTATAVPARIERAVVKPVMPAEPTPDHLRFRPRLGRGLVPYFFAQRRAIFGWCLNMYFTCLRERKGTTLNQCKPLRTRPRRQIVGVTGTWSGRLDSNQRPPGSGPGALTQLSYAQWVWWSGAHTSFLSSSSTSESVIIAQCSCTSEFS
jgi:hypothetical protein